MTLYRSTKNSFYQTMLWQAIIPQESGSTEPFPICLVLLRDKLIADVIAAPAPARSSALAMTV